MLGAGFKNIRQSAFARSLSVPFPTGSHELWRYTKPDHFDFKRLLKQQPVTFSLRPFEGAGSVSGIDLKTGAAAVDTAKEILSKLFSERSPDLANDSIAALQLATVSSVALVTVPKSYRSEAPVILSQVLPKDSGASSLVVITVEKGAQACIVEDLSGDALGLFAPRVEVVVADNAELTFGSVQRLSNQSTALSRHRFHTGRDSKLSTLHIALGAKLARLDLDLRMYEPGAQVNLLGLYLVDGHRHNDFHPTQYHLAPHCRSDLFSKGVLKGDARSVYYGYIRVAEGAQKTDAYQTNRNLILSQDARADSIPNLEIKANDVRCSHGASVSHVNKEELFYLMTRGLSRQASEELLVEGFLEELLGRVSHAALHGWLSELVAEHLGGARK